MEKLPTELFVAHGIRVEHRLAHLPSPRVSYHLVSGQYAGLERWRVQSMNL